MYDWNVYSQYNQIYHVMHLHWQPSWITCMFELKTSNLIVVWWLKRTRKCECRAHVHLLITIHSSLYRVMERFTFGSLSIMQWTCELPPSNSVCRNNYFLEMSLIPWNYNGDSQTSKMMPLEVAVTKYLRLPVRNGETRIHLFTISSIIIQCCSTRSPRAAFDPCIDLKWPAKRRGNGFCAFGASNARFIAWVLLVWSWFNGRTISGLTCEKRWNQH